MCSVSRNVFLLLGVLHCYSEFVLWLFRKEINCFLEEAIFQKLNSAK